MSAFWSMRSFKAAPMPWPELELVRTRKTKSALHSSAGYQPTIDSACRNCVQTTLLHPAYRCVEILALEFRIVVQFASSN
jgi:hypothetical protein